MSKKKKNREMPIISYVMVTCQGGLPDTIRAINSLKKSNTVPYELIVVDNGTSDATTAWLKGSKIQYVKINNLVSYGEALNKGLRQCRGQFIGILNNDIVVTPNWESAMLFVFKQAEKGRLVGVDRVGIVGPMSNAVGYDQCIDQNFLAKVNYQNNDDAIHEFGVRWFNRMWSSQEPELKDKCKRTGFLSGFCWIMSRDCYKGVGDFAEDLTPGGFEDNDYVHRAELAGFASYISLPSFVHHEGGLTFKALNMPEARRGMANRIPFYNKWMENDKLEQQQTEWEDGGKSATVWQKPKKLVAGLRVKNEERFLYECLSKLSEVVDEIVIFNDNSTDKTVSIAESFKKVVKIHHSNETTFNEARDREKLWQLCREQSPDWILIIDGDEVLEPRVTRKDFDEMMNPRNPQVYSWVFRYITLWDLPDKQRVDGTFSMRFGPRLARNLPNYHITSDHPIGLHCGSVPEYPKYNVFFSKFRILHYGYMDKADRVKKYEWYEANDTVKDQRDVGDVDYSYLMDDFAQIIPFNPDLTLGMVTCVKDEMKLPEAHLERFLSLYHYIFDEIIIVDTGSTDNSVEIAEYYGAKVIHHKWEDDFAKARNAGLDHCTTTYVMHVDPDEGFGGDAIRFRRWIEMPCLAYRVPIRHPKEGSEPMLTWKCRIFKNLKEIRYQDAVHEQIESCLKDIKGHGPIIPVVYDENQRFQGIMHYGFQKEDGFLTKKMEHYREINQKMLEKDPEHYYANYSLALHYATHGEEEKAMEYLDVAMKSRPGFAKARYQACFSHVRRGIKILEEGLPFMVDNPEEYQRAQQIIAELRQYGPKLPMIGYAKNDPRRKELGLSD